LRFKINELKEKKEEEEEAETHFAVLIKPWAFVLLFFGWRRWWRVSIFATPNHDLFD